MTTTTREWRSKHELTGLSVHGHLVDVTVGVVDTAGGPTAALCIGVCLVLVDDSFGADLMTNLLQASADARLAQGVAVS